MVNRVLVLGKADVLWAAKGLDVCCGEKLARDRRASVTSAFGAAMLGSVAEGAQLEMIDLPGRAMCYDCAGEVKIDNRFAPGPACAGGKLMPTGRDEKRVRDLEAA